MDNNFKKISLPLILLTLASVLFFPNSSFAQDEITLQSWSSCINSVAQINLSWNSISGNPDYHILRKMEGEATTTIDIIQDISYIDVPVLSDKDYNYQIKAVRNGEEFFSNEVLVPAAYCQPTLDSPTTTCQSDGPRIHLSWNPVSGDVLTYNIYRATSTNGGDPFLLTSISSTSYSDGPNIAGTTKYDYFVEVVWLDSYSTTSPGIVSPTAPACEPTLNINTNCETNTAPGGPQVNLSWNELLGVLEYQIYRDGDTLGDSLTETFYTDKLVESLPDAYDQEGVVSYFVKAIWETAIKDSLQEQINIPRCPPFLTVESNCDEFSMRLSWTATQGAIRYNVYRAPTTSGEFTYIIGSQTEDTLYIDYLNLDICPGEICNFTYKIKASISGGELYSNEVWKDIDCATIIPPSPAPHLDEPKARCQEDPLDSVISNSWSESNNVYYYSLRRVETISGNEEKPYEGPLRAHVDMGVESGYEYTYWVVAIGEGETSIISDNTVTIEAVSCLPPTSPTLTLTPGCGVTAPFMDVSWTETTNTYSYKIYRGTASNNLSHVWTSDKDSLSWRDTDVLLSTTYYYKVTAKGPSGAPSTDSSVISRRTLSCFPTTPSLYSIAPACSGAIPIIKLTWSSNGLYTDYYEIYRKDYSEDIPIDKTPSFIKTWTDSSVLPEDTYQYKVVAIGDWGQETTQGYKPSVTSYYCQSPDSFTLTGPTTYCVGSHLWATTSWTDSPHAVSYDLNRYLYDNDNGSIIETITLADVSSPFIDRGLGNALSFDGYNDYVNIPNSGSLKGATNQISVEAWIYPTSVTNWRTIISGFNGYSYNRLYLNGSRLSSYVRAGGSGSYCSGPLVKLNTWNHVVLVYDDDVNYQRLYLNGELEKSCYKSGALTSGSNPIKIGRHYYYSSSYYFKGKIDEVRIYNRALNDSEISEHYQGVYSDESELRGLWHIDEGSGSSISDSSNYGNNGTRYQASWVKNGPQCENKYSWQAIAYSEGSAGTFSNATIPEVMLLCPPSKPGLVLRPICQGEKSNVEISWSFSINATGYNIYRDGSLVASTSVIGPSPSNRIFIDDNNGSGLATGTVYTYWVEASGVAAIESDHLEVTTLDCTLPGPAEGLQVSFGCGDYGSSCPGSYPRVWLEWQETLNANYYEIWRMVGTGSYSSLATTTATSHTDAYPSVKVNTDYSYYIKAHSLGGVSTSNVASTTTGFCPLCQASVGFYTDCSYGGAPINEVSWTDKTDFNTEEYKIYRNTIDDLPSATEIVTITRAMSEFSSKYYKDNDPLLADNTTYYYWVKVMGYTGDTKLSDLSITTYNCSAVADAPADLNITTGCCQGVSCSTSTWTPSPQYAYSYNVYRNNLNDGITETYSTRISPFLDQGSFALEIENNKAEYVKVSKTDSLDFSDDRFSIEAWIYPVYSGSDTYSTFLGRFNGYYYNRISVYRYSGGPLRARFYWKNGGVDIFSGPLIDWSQWNHVVYTYDGHYQRWYLNGALTHSKLWEDKSLLKSNYNLRIGSSYSPSYEFKGTIDEVRFYGRALKPEEISDHYNGIYNNELELRGAWHFDEGIGTIAYDSSGNGNDGTFYNTPEWVKPLDSPAYVWPLSEGKSYKYYVKAFGIGTESGPSNEVSLTAPVCGPVVDSFSVTPQCSKGDSQIRLDWDTKNTSYCDVRRRREGEELFSTIRTVYYPKNFYINKGESIASGQTYEYYIEAFGEGGESVFSSIESVEARVCVGYPETPVITVSPGCYGYSPRMLIQWSEDTSGYTLSYNVWRKNKDCSGDFTRIAVGLSPDTVQYFDLDVVGGETYCYKVEAVGQGDDNFAFSDPEAGTAFADCPDREPSLPKVTFDWLLLKVGEGNSKISFYWEEVLDPNDIDSFYEIWRMVGTGSYSSLATRTADFFAYLDEDVNENTDYYYQIEAHNRNGSTFSDPLLVKLGFAPPGGFTLRGKWKGRVGRKVYLDWDKAESGAGGDVSYDVLRDDTDKFETFPVLVCTGISLPSELECYDKTPDSSEPFYKAVATNKGGSTDSNPINMQFSPPIPKWEEVFPY